MSFHENEIAVKVTIDAFVGTNLTFTPVGDGIWENNSYLLMRDISEA